MGECPSAESLERLLREELGDAEVAGILHHVERCSGCQETLDTLSRRDPDATPLALRDALREEEADPSAEADPLFRRLKREMRPPADPEPEVDGYAILDEIGRGGVGVVYRAHHRALDRFVALKMILAGPHLSAECRERFRREARAVARLRHPNIIQVYEVGERSGSPYLALELAQGGSLAEWLAGRPRSAFEAARIVAVVARAVHYAHDKGVIHRDLKPANLLLGGEKGEKSFEQFLLDLKIADFGLAKFLPEVGRSEEGPTRSGAILGTPVYVAPEQARGDISASDPAADVYSLGVILYEILTGRPPFHGATAMETLVQSAHRDPVAPTRLVAGVPRDLETICLKCLHKDPRLRYPGAGALAEDLQRFLRGEPIAARRESWPGWLVRQVRRRPGFWASLLVCTLLATLLIAGGAWTLSERMALRRAARAEQAVIERATDEDLDEMAAQLRASARVEARTTLERARGRLGVRDSSPLRQRLDRLADELALADHLETIRQRLSDSIGGLVDYSACERDYEQTFRQAEIDAVQQDPTEVARRIRSSNVAPTLLVALDHWAAIAADRSRKVRLLDVARLADPNPSEWKNQARNIRTYEDPTVLTRVVEAAPINGQSVSLLLALDFRFPLDDRRIAFLKRIQQAYPDDFWCNLQLAVVLRLLHKYTESARYCQALIALRPQTASGYFNLAAALVGGPNPSAERVEEAIANFRRASALDPTASAPRFGLAQQLVRTNRFEEAIEILQQLLARVPEEPLPYTQLGICLEAVGRHSEAEAAYRRAVRLDPKRQDLQKALRDFLLQRGRLEEARRVWQATLEADPPEHEAWYGYAELCLFLGRDEEYRLARKRLLARFAGSTQPYIAERTSRACLLLPATGEELQQAVALAERAVSVDRSRYAGVYPFFLFARALADYRVGRFDRAITTLQGEVAGVLGPAPGLVLAMALFRTGRLPEARKTLAATIARHTWPTDPVRDSDERLFRILRWEAEALIAEQ